VSGRHAGPAHEGNSRTMSMHADEKSDEGIGPMKQPNKEGSPSAEAVEERPSPEGNGGQAAAARTLRREAASNGLAAVRRAARQSKSMRFTALLHAITQVGFVCHRAQDDQEAHASQAQGDQGGVAQVNA
jgi:hypothetical protein